MARVVITGKKRVFRINTKTKVLLFSVSYLLVITILFILALSIGIGKIVKQRKSIGETGKLVVSLGQKKETLKSITSSVDSYASALSLAVPESNSSLLVSQNVRILSQKSTLILKSISATGGSVDFEVEGDLTAIVNFSKQLKAYLPLVTVDVISWKTGESAMQAAFSVKTYNKPFLATIPSIVQPLEQLTGDEANTAGLLQGYKKSEVTEFVPATPVDGRDPFN